MKKIIHLFLILIPLLSFAQQDSVSNGSGLQKSEALNFLDGPSKTLNLDFETIEEDLFLVYQGNYDDPMVYDSSNVVETDSTLFIKTLAGEYHFQNIEYPNSAEYSFYGYLGFLKPLNLQFYTTSTRLYEYLIAIDCLTGKQFSVSSFFKFDFFDFLLSKNSDQLLVYSIDGEEGPGSIIKILKLEANKATASNSFATGEWSIEKLVWIDEYSFALKTFTKKIFDEEKSMFVKKGIRYLKAAIVE